MRYSQFILFAFHDKPLNDLIAAIFRLFAERDRFLRLFNFRGRILLLHTRRHQLNDARHYQNPPGMIPV